jgi:hypothetical protein
MHPSDKYLPYSVISKLNLSYYHFLIFILSCNSSNAKRTLTFEEIEEDHEEETVTEYANDQKRKKQGPPTNLYNILSNRLLILLWISYSIEDEASQNDVQDKNMDTFPKSQI